MTRQWSQRLAGIVLLTSLAVVPGHAQEDLPVADLEATEARFHAVASHLDLGGDFYFYLNLDDLAERALAGAREMLEPFSNEEMVHLVTDKMAVADDLLRESGIYNIASIGMSSKPAANGLSKSKTFIGIDNFLDQGLLWSVLGGAPPSEMAVHTFVPENPALVRSVQFHPSAGWAWIRHVVERIAGAEVLGEVDQALAEGEEASGVQFDDLLSSLGTSFLVSAYLDSEQIVVLPFGPESRELPAPSLLLAIGVNGDGLRDLLQKQLVDAGMLITTQVVDGIEVLQMPQPFPTPMPLQPAMAQHDGFLLIASTPDLLQRALAARNGSGRFLESAAYTRAFSGMPSAVNGLAFADTSIASLIIDLQMAGIESELAGQPEVLNALREWMEQLAGVEAAAVQVNLPDGILMEVSSSRSGREHIATLLTVAPAAVVAAITAPAFTHARAQSMRTVCASNLQMINAAKQLWALERGLEDGEMPPPDGLTPYLPRGLPVCPEGGVYTLGPVGTSPNCSIHGTTDGP